MHQYKNHDTLSSPTVRTVLDQIYENFVVVPIDKAKKKSVALTCKRFYAFVITKELGLGARRVPIKR